jgi:hypothetical protein
VGTTTGDDRRTEEAGTDEVTALAAMIAAPVRPHGLDFDEDDEPLPSTRDDQDGPTVVLPRQRDEFTCPHCHLVMHLSRRIGDVCRDCC